MRAYVRSVSGDMTYCACSIYGDIDFNIYTCLRELIYCLYWKFPWDYPLLLAGLRCAHERVDLYSSLIAMDKAIESALNNTALPCWK